MSGGAVATVAAMFSAFATRDIERAVALADRRIVLTASLTGERAGRTGDYRGHDGIRDYFRDVDAVWQELRITPTEFRQVGDAVVVLGKVEAHDRRHMISGSTGSVWKARRGKVVSVRIYPSAADALAAAEAAASA